VDESGTLLTIAEVAATFLGFSTIFFVLRRDDVPDDRRIFMRTVAETGLAVTFGSLLPFFVHGLTHNAALAWRGSAGVFAVGWIASLVADVRRYHGAGLSATLSGTWYSLDNVMNVVGIGSLLWVTAFGPAVSGALYTIAMACLLLICGASFIAGAFGRPR